MAIKYVVLCQQWIRKNIRGYFDYVGYTLYETYSEAKLAVIKANNLVAQHGQETQKLLLGEPYLCIAEGTEINFMRSKKPILVVWHGRPPHHLENTDLVRDAATPLLLAVLPREAKPAIQPAVQPAPAPQPALTPPVQPAAQPQVQPAPKPAPQSAAQPAAQPAPKPAVPPETKPEAPRPQIVIPPARKPAPRPKKKPRKKPGKK